MQKNRFIAAALSAALMSFGTSVTFIPSVSADDTEKHTVTFLDFDGNVMKTLSVAPNENIDYASVDTSSLHKHIDKYTERDFSSWDISPVTTSSDITVHALSKTAFISLDGVPAVTKYFARDGKIDLYGLKVAITITTQLPEKDANGNYMTSIDSVDITSSCKVSPSHLKDAFNGTDTAKVDIMPIGDDKPLYSYEISCYDYFGDVNENGSIDSVDASAVLTAYAKNAANASYTMTDAFKKRADVNLDNMVDARDASYILRYYALSSVNGTADWNEIVTFAK